MSRRVRAQAHAALGDERRLKIVDLLASSDRTVAELARSVGMGTNLLAHHLDILEDASLIKRQVSEGDHRRKYVSLVWESLPHSPEPTPHSGGTVVFVCTHNSARSQFAAALWKQATGQTALSAGRQPADAVHPLAVKAAARMAIDLSSARPRGYEAITMRPDLLISVCDRAREGGLPDSKASIHWSVPDPVLGGKLRSFEEAFAEISLRLNRLTQSVGTRQQAQPTT
jgi:ArsR family transcriptional regulator, arsenate/arsenite/antimonite-responsive transcriptional repressor / arsenate reductase (thioredoxin)